jgi:CMP-N-acetylneuraminic acid synthetase
MKVLGIIPARGGSKGVHKKNIRMVDGKPLIYYSIEVGKKSKLITDLIVTSDSDEILDVVKKYKCNYFKRCDENAQDNTPIEPVVFEVLKKIKIKYDFIVLLQPTAPIREVEDIDNVIQMLINNKDLDTVVSVVELEDIHPARMYSINGNMEMKPLNPLLERKRRQDLDPVYLRNGAIYATRIDTFLKTKKLINDSKKAYIMPESKWANVDTERDLLIVELLIKEWKLGKL